MLTTALGAIWLVLAPGATTPGELLLSVEARTAFVARHAPAYLQIRFQPPTPPGQEPSLTPATTTLATFVVGGPSAEPQLVAPEHRLRGVDRADVVLPDGRAFPVTVKHPPKPDETPLARLVPVPSGDPPRPPTWLEGRSALPWAAADEAVQGARTWAIEWAPTPHPDGTRFTPVLIDAELLEPVEYPLERFFYVRLRQADGLALLNARGAVLCVVFRAVPGTRDTSICAPPDAAFSAAPERP